MPAPGRIYTRFALTLDGKSCGFLKSVEGGVVSAEVVHEPFGSEFIIEKHLGPIRFEEFSVQTGLNMGKALYDWLAASWTANYQRKSGAIITADQNLDARSQGEFSNALITETSFPAFDASSKDAAYLTIKFAPESTRYTKASGKVPTDAGGKTGKAWQASNFRLEIDGLDCKRVSKVDSFAVKQSLREDRGGEVRDDQREPGKLDFPNLKITLAENGADSWVQWHEDFVIKGKNDKAAEKKGALILLDPSLKTELARINLFNLGIYRLASQASAAGAESIARLTAELYCERMELVIGGAALAPKAPAGLSLPKPARVTR